MMLCGYVENYFCIQNEEIFYYMLQRMIVGIINTLSIGSIGDNFNLFSIECVLFQLFYWVCVKIKPFMI
jgi:hypothetical protein